MNFPSEHDFINVHTHGAGPEPGIWSVETLMAHENRVPDHADGLAYVTGIHPWNLTSENYDSQIAYIKRTIRNDTVIALGEAGFDRLRGPEMSLQRKAFEEQVAISESYGKPVVIHCVKAWEDLLDSYRRIGPSLPWLIHGFHGKKELASSLLSKGMYLSFWFDFIVRPEAASLVSALPLNRIFLETDGSQTGIRDIYTKVSAHLGLTVEELKRQIFHNYCEFFNPPTGARKG
jgi:TatD DNase family protein